MACRYFLFCPVEADKPAWPEIAIGIDDMAPECCFTQAEKGDHLAPKRDQFQLVTCGIQRCIAEFDRVLQNQCSGAGNAPCADAAMAPGIHQQKRPTRRIVPDSRRSQRVVEHVDTRLEAALLMQTHPTTPFQSPKAKGQGQAGRGAGHECGELAPFALDFRQIQFKGRAQR